MDIQTSFNMTLLFLALLAAVAMSFTAVYIITFEEKQKRYTRFISLCIWSLGLWTTYLLTLFAWEVPLHVSFSSLLLVISLVVTTLAVWTAVYYLNAHFSQRRLVFTTLFLSASFGAMHFIGIFGLQIAANISYDWLWLFFALCSAVLLSYLYLKSITKASFQRRPFAFGLTAGLTQGLTAFFFHTTALSSIELTYSNTLRQHEPFYAVSNDHAAIPIAVFIVIIVSMFFYIAYKNIKMMQSVQKKEQETRDILASISDPFIFADNDGKIIYMNNTAARFLSLDKKVLNNVLHTKVFQKNPALIQHIQHASNKLEEEIQFEGEWLEVTFYPSPSGWGILMESITWQKEMDWLIQERERKFRAVFNFSSVPLVVADRDLNILEANNEFHSLFSSDAKMQLYDWISEEDHLKVQQKQEQLFTGTLAAYTLALKILVGDELREFEMKASIVDSSYTQKAYSVHVLEDVSKQQAEKYELQIEKARMEKEAKLDELTGVYNRRAFEELLQVLWGSVKNQRIPLAALFIDVDNFKDYNDRYNHLEGDRCLQAVANALKAELTREMDTVARFGGEEFVVLLPGANKTEALEVGENLRNSIESLNIKHEGSPYGIVTVSIGAAVVTATDHHNARDFLKEADEALYKAKDGDKNTVAYIQTKP